MKYFKIYILITLIILLFLINNNNNNNIESFYFDSDTTNENDNLCTTFVTEDTCDITKCKWVDNSCVELSDNLETDCENITDIKNSLKEVWDDIPDKYTKSIKEQYIINQWESYLIQPIDKNNCNMVGSPNCCE